MAIATCGRSHPGGVDCLWDEESLRAEEGKAQYDDEHGFLEMNTTMDDSQ